MNNIKAIKNSEKAREYLDLTEGEYSRIFEIASKVTAARLSYHVSLLESAMADMQRAFNSKRSIAEIALTRMCDAKNALSIESLSVRVEELEKKVSMLKMGIASNSMSAEENVTVLPTVKASDTEKNKIDGTPSLSGDNEQKKITPYDNWSYALERIGELRQPLLSKLKDSIAYRLPSGAYLIRLGEFFANMISGNSEELSILRGVIADIEDTSADKIEIFIEPLDTRSSRFGDELDSLLN